MKHEAKTVFFVDRCGVQEGIAPEFLTVPFIIDEAGKPDSHVNEYLLARRNGDWAAKVIDRGDSTEIHGRTVLRANLTYLRNRAYQLDVHRRWLRSEGLTYATVDESILDRFAEDLEEGLLTNDEGGLLPSSVNQYLISVIDFLRYAAEVGWRGPLSLRMRRCRRDGKGGTPIVMRRVNPAELDIWYTEDQIGTFINEFETASGKLAARIIFGTGLRISEVRSLTTAMIPSKESWLRDPAARNIEITGKFGKSRRVYVSKELLAYIHRFIDFDLKIVARSLKQPPKTLLIAPNGSGEAMSARRIQKEFVRAREAAGFKALSPHLLRHHYAAHFLLRAWRRKTQRWVGLGPAADTSLATTLLQSEVIVLMASLGHERIETTMKYLHALFYLSGSNLSDAYSTELDPEDDL